MKSCHYTQDTPAHETKITIASINFEVPQILSIHDLMSLIEHV